MSIEAVGWVMKHSASKGAGRLVALSLANYADDNGVCWPAQRTIASDARVSPGSIPKAIRSLVDLGELVVINAGDARRSARYMLTFVHPEDECPTCASAQSASAGSAQSASAARGPRVSAARGPGPRGTVINRHEENHGRTREAEEVALARGRGRTDATTDITEDDALAIATSPLWTEAQGDAYLDGFRSVRDHQ